MSTAPIAAVPTDMSSVPPSAPPSAPGTSTFSDMLASATTSLAAFALLPTSTGGALSGVGNPPPPPKKNPDNDNAAVPIALPTPVQTPVAPAAADASESSATPATTAAASGTQQTPQSAQATATGSTGTAGTSSASAQAAAGAALPPMAAELNARIALGAQALLSQPSQVLATLPHGAVQTAAPTLALNLGAAAHGATATDPTAALPKLAASATSAAATPSTTPQTVETALQTATAQTAASTTAATDAATASASGPTDQTDPAFAATPAPAAVPLPGTDAAANLGDALPPAVAASALDQVAASLSQVGKLGLSQIEIQLKPAALGTVDVKLELTHDGRVAAVITADRSDTLTQLQRGSGELQQALRDAGLQTDSGSLSFNLRSDAQTGDQSGRQPGYAAPQSVAASASDDVPAVPAPLAGPSQSAHSGLLNIQV